MYGLFHRITKQHKACDETHSVSEEFPPAKIARTASEFLCNTNLIVIAPALIVIAPTLVVIAILPPKVVRKVSFCRSVEVLLVPCLAEYRAANVVSSVWWSPVEMKQFRVEVVMSVQRCMTRFTTLDRRQALKIVVIDPEAFMLEDMSMMPTEIMVQ